MPSDNGLVVQLLDTDNNSIVDALDSIGDGLPNDLNNNGSFADEVSGLENSSLYTPDSTWWRFEVDHFTPWDANWPYAPPADATAPNPEGEPSADQQLDTNDEEDCINSYIERKSRIFHEDIPISGTDFTLHYTSNRVDGYKDVVTIPVSGQSLPASLKRIEVSLHIAGQTFKHTLAPLPNQMVEFIWDKHDYLGNDVTGSTIANINIGFVYDAVYTKAGNFQQSFAQAGNNITAIRARQEIISLKKNYITIIAPQKKGSETIAEGWTISDHHSWYQYSKNILQKGNGAVINNNVETITTFTGTGEWGFSGDGGPASDAIFSGPLGMAIDSVGNLYIADAGNSRIRKVDTNGIITTVAGNGNKGFSGDGGPATQATFDWISNIATDSAGNLYIADSGNYRVRKVDPNGIITTIAGNGVRNYSGDGGPAIQAEFNGIGGIVTDSNGNLYITDTGLNNRNSRIRRIDTSGIITTVAGSLFNGFSGDGSPATQAQLSAPWGLAIDSIGNIYIADAGNNRIRKVDTSGIIKTIAGSDLWGVDIGDGGPATLAVLDFPEGIAIDNAGNLYITEFSEGRVRKVSPPELFAGLISSGDTVFSDETGLGYIMDNRGFHTSTIDLATGMTLRTFGYNGDSQLTTITDQFGNQTTIQRNTLGIPISITSPDGIVTSLTIDQNNYLTQITNPDNSNFFFSYTADGLLTDEYDFRGNQFHHIYDISGRVIQVNDPEGGTWDYSRTAEINGNITTTVQTGEGNTTTYIDRTESTGASTSVKTNPDGSISTIRREPDGITEAQELPCGMDLTIKYDLDSEYKYKFPGEIIRTSPDGLIGTITSNRTYEDTNADNIPDLITNTVTINGKEWSSENNTNAGIITNTSPLGREINIKYNTQNLLTEEISVTGLLPTNFSYDTRGRLTSTTTGTRTTTRAYDLNGNLDFIITPDNKTIDYTFDILGRLTQEERPDTTTINYSHDDNGNITALVTPTFINHTFDYTSTNQRKDYTTPISGSYLYTYDKERKLKNITFPSGSQLINTYTNGLLTNTVTPESTIDFTYGCPSRLTQTSMGTEEISYTYDGSLLKTDTRTGIINQTINFTYDNDFSISSITYAGQTDVLAYDDDGLTTSIGGFTITRNVDNGLPESVNDTTFTQSRNFNGYGDVSNYSNTVNSTNLYNVSLTRDSAARIIQRTETIDTETITWDYQYDDLGRLIEVKKNNTIVETYSYDANGNRTNETNTLRGIPTKSFTYSNEDHIISAGNDTYVFDDDGFLVQKASPGGTDTYDYSLRGELLTVFLSDGRTITYDHDPLGRRISKKIDGTVVEKYLWNGNTTLLAIYDSADNLVTRFNYADSRLPVSMLHNGITYYMMYDQVGTLRLVVDSAGSVIKRVDNDSFGNIITDSNISFKVPFGFAGGLHDRDTGLVRFGARDFDPTIGRWTAKDPIDFAGGDTNLYGYVLNDPVDFVDPLGLIAPGNPNAPSYGPSTFGASCQVFFEDDFRDYLNSTSGFANLFATISFLVPGGQTASLVFVGIGITAKSIEISLYSDRALTDSITEAVKVANPLKKPYDMLSNPGIDYVSDMVDDLLSDYFSNGED